MAEAAVIVSYDIQAAVGLQSFVAIHVDDNEPVRWSGDQLQAVLNALEAGVDQIRLAMNDADV